MKKSKRVISSILILASLAVDSYGQKVQKEEEKPKHELGAHVEFGRVIYPSLKLSYRYLLPKKINLKSELQFSGGNTAWYNTRRYLGFIPTPWPLTDLDSNNHFFGVENSYQHNFFNSQLNLGVEKDIRLFKNLSFRGGIDITMGYLKHNDERTLSKFSLDSNFNGEYEVHESQKAYSAKNIGFVNKVNYNSTLVSMSAKLSIGFLFEITDRTSLLASFYYERGNMREISRKEIFDNNTQTDLFDQTSTSPWSSLHTSNGFSLGITRTF